MRVVEWISYAEAQPKEASCGGLGGWFGCHEQGGEHRFGAPHRWADYVNATVPEQLPYVEAIKADVLASGRFITGQQHQDEEDGVPLFEDGTVGVFSYRAWGDLMAAIATEKDGRDHHYMEFYC